LEEFRYPATGLNNLDFDPIIINKDLNVKYLNTQAGPETSSDASDRE